MVKHEARRRGRDLKRRNPDGWLEFLGVLLRS